jgi:hypothetical protein
MGLDILYFSKWLNGVLVKSNDQLLIDTLINLSFVDTHRWEPVTDDLYFPGPPSGNRFSEPYIVPPEYHYGFSFDQIYQLNLPFLHAKGYTGNGVLLAVLDAGFSRLPDLPAFQSAIDNGKIMQTKNFVNKSLDVYNSHSHGTNVSSIIVANWPDTLMGTSPDVDLLLASTENPASETRIEEYSWIEAAEWADSLGVDILNTSLGYTTFDDSTTNYSYKDLDGKTAHISIANSMTASKGIISVTSAGNSGNDPWYYIGAPADATDILSVGAVNNIGDLAPFSSHGPTYDYRIKPEVSAMGSYTAIQSTDSSVRLGSGTSFSSPMIAGATAVLWQAYPALSAKELMRWIIDSGDRAGFPDVQYGYGIPNFKGAFYAITSLENRNYFGNIKVYPNPFTSYIHIEIPESLDNKFSMRMYDMQGRIVYTKELILPGSIDLPNALHPGIYLIELKGNQTNYRSRIIKN